MFPIFNQMIEIVKRSITFINCGYQIDLPLQEDHPEIPNNRNQALSRFHSLERRLAEPSMRVLADQYEQAVEKLISSGTVVPVDRSAINEPKGLVWYLPHFFVTNPNKPEKSVSSSTQPHDFARFATTIYSSEVHLLYQVSSAYYFDLVNFE